MEFKHENTFTAITNWYYLNKVLKILNYAQDFKFVNSLVLLDLLMENIKYSKEIIMLKIGDLFYQKDIKIL